MKPVIALQEAGVPVDALRKELLGLTRLQAHIPASAAQHGQVQARQGSSTITGQKQLKTAEDIPWAAETEEVLRSARRRAIYLSERGSS